MGDRFKQIYVFLFMNLLFTNISMSLHRLMPILHLVHWITKSIIDTMKYHAGMHDFIHLGEANTSYICCNNTQQWCGVVYELNPTFLDFIDDFLHYVTHLNMCFFHGGGWTWRLVVIFLFFHIGGIIIRFHKFTHINNPWFFRVIFIGLFIIKFIVINVQISRVHKHGSKTLHNQIHTMSHNIEWYFL